MKKIRKHLSKYPHTKRYSLFSLIAIIALIFLSFFISRLPHLLGMPVFGAQHTPLQTGNLISWPLFGGDSARSGINSQETILTPQNVSRLQQFWQITLSSDKVDSAPVYQPNVTTPQGVYNLLFVNTLAGNLIAIDSDTGIIIWTATHKKLTLTTSSPAIDPNGQFIYNYALDGYVHKYMIGTGLEVSDGTFPVQITQNPAMEKGSSAINIGNGYLYMPTSTQSYLEGKPTNVYFGHVVSVNLATGTKNIFNTECSNIHGFLTTASDSANFCPNQMGGIWARGGALIDPITQNVFVTTANALYDANTGGFNYGDSIVELSPDLSQIIDSYTPTNYQALQIGDSDLGITAPVFLPVQNGSNTPYMITQGGKDKVVRLINKPNLSGQGGTGHVGGELQMVSLKKGCIMFPQSLAWTDSSGQTWVFETEGCSMYVYKVLTTSGVTSLQLAYQKTPGGSSPVMANNILFLQGATTLSALDPTTGTVLWSTPMQSLHWQSPIVVNGRIYTADNSGHVMAYALPSLPTLTLTPTDIATATPTITPSVTSNVTPSVTIAPTPTPTVIPTPTSTQINISDNFQRTDQTGWGTASDGNIWGGQANKSTTIFSVSNNTGGIAGTGYYVGILGPSLANAQVMVQGTITNLNPGNFGVILRYVDTKDWYEAHINGTRLYIIKNVNGVSGTIANVAASTSPNVMYTLKFQVQGTTLSAKVWQSGNPEPTNWMATGTDTSLLTGTGGIRVNINAATAVFTSFSLIGL